MRLLLCAGLVALAGCASTEERAASDDQKCLGYGMTPGSDGYAGCRMTIDQNRVQAREMKKAAAGAAVVNAQLMRAY
jgi:hypothetical protein